MASIDPFKRYKPLPLSRHRRTKLPSFRTVIIFSLLFIAILMSKTSLMNQYNYING